MKLETAKLLEGYSSKPGVYIQEYQPSPEIITHGIVVESQSEFLNIIANAIEEMNDIDCLDIAEAALIVEALRNMKSMRLGLEIIYY